MEGVAGEVEKARALFEKGLVVGPANVPSLQVGRVGDGLTLLY